jgi:Methylamine utilisation protein MauE
VDLLAAVAALTTSLLLLASGIAHLRRPVGAELAVHAVLPRNVRPAVAIALPAAELLAGLAGVGTLRGPALVLQAVLFAAFAAYLALVVRAGGAGVPCGCGLPEVPVGPVAVSRAAALAALALVAAAFSGGRPPDAGSLALLAVAAPTLALLVAIVPAARRLTTPTGAAL